jgi:hypothetical protein
VRPSMSRLLAMTHIVRTGWPRPDEARIETLGRSRVLAWSFPAARPSPAAYARPESACLDEFLALPAEPESQLVEFARRWGVLGACWHGGEHNSHDTTISLAALADMWPRMSYRVDLVRGAGPPPPPGARPRVTQKGIRQVDHWTRLSRTLAATIRLNFELLHDRPGPIEDWTLMWGLSGAGEWAARRPLEEQRWVIDELLKHWQVEAHLVSAARLSTTADAVEVDPRGLDAALVLFTREAVRLGQTVLTCSACGRPYLRDRLPRTGEQNYCQNDGRRASWAHAQAERRKTLTDEQRTAERQKTAERMRALRKRQKEIDNA